MRRNIPFNVIIIMISGEQTGEQIIKFLIIEANFCQSFVTSPFLGSNIFLNTLFSYTLNLCSVVHDSPTSNFAAMYVNGYLYRHIKTTLIYFLSSHLSH
jgi:hypothetical protein